LQDGQSPAHHGFLQASKDLCHPVTVDGADLVENDRTLLSLAISPFSGYNYTMFRRYSEELIVTAMGDTPVVLLNGARQTGKTTLVQAIARNKLKSAAYLTLDDAAVLAAAAYDPQGLLDGLQGTVIIDEVQKAPGLFPAIKLNVDRDRRPGRFLLTGSANVLALPALSESLAGRMEIITLRPLSQGELDASRGALIDRLFAGREPSVSSASVHRDSLAERVHRGGYPEVVQRPAGRRANWFASYLTSILQRDVRDLSNIEGLTEAPRLLSLLATRSAGLLNVADVSRAAAIPHTTLQRYLALFEATFMIQRIPPWSANLGKRLVKTPKLLFGDTGLMAYLLNASVKSVLEDTHIAGRFLETFVGSELLKQIEWSERRPRLLHYRTGAGAEVDFVLEAGGHQVVGVEVKLGATLGADDFRGLRSLAADAGSRLSAGVVLYTGEQVIPFGGNLWALPMGALWR
jgi:predicted AAA+ superfamily ATPase